MIFTHALPMRDGELQKEADWKVLRTWPGVDWHERDNTSKCHDRSWGEIGAATLAVADVPDHAVIAAVPGRVIGDARERERTR